MNTEYVKTTIRIPKPLMERLERRAEKSCVSKAEYIRSLLSDKSLAAEPPDELWAVMDELYAVHDMLLRIRKPEFTEAARRLEQTVVDLQAAFTAPRKVAS